MPTVTAVSGSGTRVRQDLERRHDREHPTTATLAAPRPVDLGEVRRGLVDPADGCRDLDAVLDAARDAERDGAAAVVVPAPDADRPDAHHWPATAQALAVLLATTSVRVVVPVHPGAWEAASLARFAGGATRLAGDRLVVRVLGPTGRAALFAEQLRALWDGEVVVGD